MLSYYILSQKVISFRVKQMLHFASKYVTVRADITFCVNCYRTLVMAIDCPLSWRGGFARYFIIVTSGSSALVLFLFLSSMFPLAMSRPFKVCLSPRNLSFSSGVSHW